MENSYIIHLDDFETFSRRLDNTVEEQKSCSGCPKLSKFKDFVVEEKKIKTKDDKKNNDNGDSESEFEDDDDRIREYDGDLLRRCIPLSMGPMPSTSIY